MSYFRVCPYCESHLDPGERCDCMDPKPSEKGQQYHARDQTAERWPRAAQNRPAAYPGARASREA